MPTGPRIFQAALGLGAEPFTDCRDARWIVRAIEAVGVAADTLVLESRASASPEVIVAKPAEGQEAPMNVVFEVAPLPDGELFSLGGSAESWSSILPAGRWRVVTTDSLYRRAETETELEAGEERNVDLLLQ